MTSPLTPWSEAVYLEAVEHQDLLNHDATLRTTGEGDGTTDTEYTKDDYVVLVGADTSARGIAPVFRDEINPADLPDGYVAGPEPRTAPIY